MNPRNDPPARPSVRVGTGIIDRHLVDECFKIRAGESLGQMKLGRVRYPFSSQPKLVVEPYAIDNERVAFPVTDRMSEPSRFDLRWVLAAIHVHYPPRVGRADADENDLLRVFELDNLEAVWRMKHPWAAGRFAARVRVILGERSLAIVVCLARPWLKRDFVYR